MTDKFRNKYRIQSTRLSTWDYSWNGSYFITTCTKRRRHYFGEIPDKEMQLSDIGLKAHECWSEIPDHFEFVSLGEFTVMPNHVHGILIIDGDGNDSIPVDTGMPCIYNRTRGSAPRAKTQYPPWLDHSNPL